MRHLILPAAALVVLATTATAFAGGGLPHITSLKAGSYSVNVYNDSVDVQTGSNTFTVEVPDLPEGHSIQFVMVSAAGTSVPVPLQPLKFVTGPAEAHGDDHGAEGAGDSHGGGDAHGGDHGADAVGAEGTTFRGKVRLGTSGTWTAVLEVLDDHGKPVAKAEQALDVVSGGPNPFFLAFAGLAMGGTAIYGAVERRRQQASRR